MPSTTKLLLGLLGVAFLTWFTLQPLGGARAVAEDLEARTAAALEAEGAEGISVRAERRPVSRTITLAGDVPDDIKRRIREIALAQPGVSAAVWAGEADAGPPTTAASGEPAATEAVTVADCQTAIDDAIAGGQIQFRSGSAYLSPASNRLIDALAEAARGCEAVQIEIAGHSNRTGREGVNLEMSSERAVRVRDALIERGVAAAMLRTIGKGSSEPLGGNPADPANRRIEFTVSAAGTAAGGES